MGTIEYREGNRWVMVKFEEVTDLAICVDCLIVTANGVDDDDNLRATADAIAQEWAGWTLTNACPENCDGWFSWAACDGCGSHLGGERHPAAAFRTVPQP